MGYEIIKRFISKNRPGKALVPVGSVLHETATPGATDEAEYNYFNRGDRGASAHAFVDFDSITQTIPWNEQAWHAGPTANHTRIGIELCHYDDAAKFKAVWDRAVWLFAWLHINIIKETKITNENLMSHAEVSNKWHETTHQDPISYFAKFGKTVDEFRAEVQKEINNMLGKKESDMKILVVYSGDADAFAAVIVSQKFNCPMMKKSDFDSSGLKADRVIQIGGTPNSTRFTAFRDAAKLV